MKVISVIISSLLGSINNSIVNMDRKTRQSIRQGFFFGIFVLSVGGIILGVLSGKEAASIKGTPLAETMRDTFEYTESRSKAEGNFGAMLEGRLMSESAYREIDRTRWKTREAAEMTFSDKPAEPASSTPRNNTPMNSYDEIIEGKYRPEKKAAPVNKVNRKENTAPLAEPIIPGEKRAQERIDKDRVRSLKRDGESGTKVPSQIFEDKGIISN